MLVDGSNLAYRAFHRFSEIRSREMGNVGLIYGFMKIMQSYLLRFQPTRVIVTFDSKQSKKSNFRLKLFPEYKASRGKKNIAFDQDSFNKQVRATIKMLTRFGIDVVVDRKGLGHESDDYLAYLAKEAVCKVLIVSSDKDFFQLLDKNVKIFNPFKECIIRYDTCEAETGYTPEKHRDFLILTGDKSDNIPGYRGVGPVTAKQFLDTYGSIEHYLSNNENASPKVTQEGVDFLYKRNRPLIDLDYALKQYPIKTIPLKKGKYNQVTLLEILDKYSMTTFMAPKFIKPFKDLL